MTPIRLTAISKSLAATYGVLKFEGEGVRGNGSNKCVCSICEASIVENIDGLPNFENAATICNNCGVHLNLTKTSRYRSPTNMLGHLSARTCPLNVFTASPVWVNSPQATDFNELESRLMAPWNEFQSERPRFFYHYTTVAGLHGIISSGSLWATDIAYMNDASEMKYALDIINEQIGARANSESSLVKELLRRASISESPEGASSSYFAICFCSDGGLLSQWRAYSNSGRGYSIGFDSYSFDAQSYFVRRVLYNEGQQRALITATLDETLGLFHKIAAKKDSKELMGTLPAFSAFLSGHLTEFLYSFKHPAFEEENEWRIVFNMPRSKSLPHLNFRENSTGPIPFLVTRFEQDITKAPSLPMLEIVQGPTLHPELGKKATHLLLEKCGYDHVEVRGSNTPLRI